MAKNKLSQYDLFNSRVALDAIRDDGRVAMTRIVNRVLDYSQTDQLSKGQAPVVEIIAVDRFMSYKLDNGRSLKYSSGTGEAYFTSNGMLYRIRPLTDQEESRFSPEDGDEDDDDSEDDREALVAGVLSFLGGNSEAARRARAQIQRRDRRGRFAEMGGGFTVSIRGIDGSFSAVSGRVVGSSGDGDIEVQVDNPMGGLPKGIYVFPSVRGTAAKAILSDEAFKDAPNVDLEQVDFEKEDSFVDAADVKILDVPSDWEEIEVGKRPFKVYRSSDGYFVRMPQKDNPFSSGSWEIYRPNFYTADDGEPDGYDDRGELIDSQDAKSWADVQKVIANDVDAVEEDAAKALEFIQGSKTPIKPVKPTKSEGALEIATKAAQSVTDEQRQAFKVVGEVMRSTSGSNEERAKKLHAALFAAFDGATFTDKNGKQLRIKLNAEQMPEDNDGYQWYFTDQYMGEGEVARAFYSGEIIDDETGEKIGNFTRGLKFKDSGDLIVQHELLEFDESQQSRGAGSMFNAVAETLYREADVDQIDLAGSSSLKLTHKDTQYIGATHWGRNGFDWRTNDDRQTHIVGARDAIAAWRDGSERTDSFGNPYFDSDDQVDDLEALIDRAEAEDFDDPFRYVAGDLVRWPGADSWFAHHAYSYGEKVGGSTPAGSLVEYTKRLTPQKSKVVKTPDATPAADPSPDVTPVQQPVADTLPDELPDVIYHPTTGAPLPDSIKNTKWKGTVPPRDALVRDADLSGAILNGLTLLDLDLTNVDLTDADLSGSAFMTVKLVGAIMNRTKLRNTSFYDADLSSAELTDVDALSASFPDAEFASTRINGGSFQGATFAGSKFSDETKFNKANLDSSSFRNASFSDTYFVDSSLDSVKMEKISVSTSVFFQGSNLKNANFKEAKFNGHNGYFSNVDIDNATFADADLSFVYFTDVKAAYIDFSGAVTESVVFSGNNNIGTVELDDVSSQGITGLNIKTLGSTTNVSNWKKIGGQSGSNEGGLYEDEYGVKHYVKVAKSQTHAENETLASRLYSLSGVKAISVNTADGDDDRPRTFSPIVASDPEGKTLYDAVRSGDQKILDEIRNGFAVDAWLSNWDVAGLTFDNMIIGVDGRPVRVDPGGALMFRAQGEPKGDMFGDVVSEIDSLRDPGVNPQSAKLFGDMTDEQIRNSVMRVARITTEQITDLVDSTVSDPDVADMLKKRLIKRREDLMARFNVTEAEAVATGSNSTIRGRGEKIGSAVDESSPSIKPYNASLKPNPWLNLTNAFGTPIGVKAKTLSYSIKDVEGGDDRSLEWTVDLKRLDNLISNGFNYSTGEMTRSAVLGEDGFDRSTRLDVTANVAALLSTGRFDEAVLYLRGLQAGVDEFEPDDPRELKPTIERLYNAILSADAELFGVDDVDDAIQENYLKYEVFELLSEGKPEYDLPLYEALRATPEEIVKKLSEYPRDEIDRAGVPRYVDRDPLPFTESDFSSVKSIVDAARTVAKGKVAKEDSLADGIDVEDGVVTFYKKATYGGDWVYAIRQGDSSSTPVWQRVSYPSSYDNAMPDRPVGVADITSKSMAMRYKLTSWALDDLKKRIAGDNSGLWEYDSVAQIDPGTLGEDGFVYRHETEISGALQGNGYGIDTGIGTYTYVDPDGRFTIKVKMGKDKQFLAANGAVDVTFRDMEPSESDIRDAFLIAGVRDPRPARKQDMRTLAENRLISVFGSFIKRSGLTRPDRDELEYYLGTDYKFSDVTKNASGRAREMVLEALETNFGITVDDIEIFTGENGLVEMRLSKSAVEVLMDETGVTQFHHNVFADTKDPDETARKLVSLLLGGEDGSVLPGLQSTSERFNSGKQAVGMSSQADMNTGGADYVYLGTGPGAVYSVRDETPLLQFKAEAIFRRGEIWANRFDRFGSRDGHDDILEELRPGSYETMIKRHIGPEMIDKIIVTKAVKAAIIARLNRFGITTMYGIPLEEFFVAV